MMLYPVTRMRRLYHSPITEPHVPLGSDPRTFGGVKCTGVHPTQLLDSPSTFRYTPSELTD